MKSGSIFNPVMTEGIGQEQTDQASKALERGSFGMSHGAFVVTEKESFRWPRGARIITIRGSALNLSPLARLLLPGQRMSLIAAQFSSQEKRC
jgi:hypothetical protein